MNSSRTSKLLFWHLRGAIQSCCHEMRSRGPSILKPGIENRDVPILVGGRQHIQRDRIHTVRRECHLRARQRLERRLA